MPAKRLSTTAEPPPVAGSNNNIATATITAVTPLNNVINGMGRLTPARDLTLGGRGAGAGAKKVFAPNLNAVRNKNTNVKTSKDFTQPRGGRRGARGGAGTTRGRGCTGNSSLIQTTGVFSEGAGAVQLRKYSGGGSSFARSGEEVTVPRKRIDRKDDKLQDVRVRELIGGSDASGDDEPASDNDTELDKTDLALRPVMLAEGLWHSQKLDIKQETRSVPNSSNDHKEPLSVAHHLQSLHMGVQGELEEPPAQYGRYPRSISAFLDAPQSQIFVMQLPNVLPCVTDEADNAPAAGQQPAAVAEQPNSPNPAQTTLGAQKHSVLEQLEEGQIGKILRYRSGRVKLLLGDTRFDLDMGLESGFLQEIMSITCNREQRSGNMINLGPIQAKLKATPDWEYLFEQQEAAAKIPTIPTASTIPPADSGGSST